MSVIAYSRQVPDPLVYPLTDNKRLVQLLAEVTGKSVDVARRTLCAIERDPTSWFTKEFGRWKLQPYVWDDKLADLYGQTDVFLFGGIVWNRRPAKLKMRKWIAEYLIRNEPGRAKRDAPSSLRVLTIGDGPGFDSLYLAQCGFRVTYSEISERCISFAQKLFELSNHPVSVVQNSSEIEEEGYDVVVCLDVLEHVPDPRELVAQFVRHLRPGGRLVVHAPFFFVSRHTPTHLSCNRRYSGDLARLYAPHGFVLLDGRFFWDPLVLLKRSTPSVLENPGEPFSQRRCWRAALRLSGLLLAVGRRWCTLHNLVAGRMKIKADPRWLKDLQSQCPGGNEAPQAE